MESEIEELLILEKKVKNIKKRIRERERNRKRLLSTVKHTKQLRIIVHH